jgi:hypothetical protein
MSTDPAAPNPFLAFFDRIGPGRVFRTIVWVFFIFYAFDAVMTYSWRMNHFGGQASAVQQTGEAAERLLHLAAWFGITFALDRLTRR